MKTKLVLLLFFQLIYYSASSHHKTIDYYNSFNEWKKFEGKDLKSKPDQENNTPKVLYAQVRFSEKQPSKNKVKEEANTHSFFSIKYKVLPFILIPIISLAVFIILILKSYPKPTSFIRKG